MKQKFFKIASICFQFLLIASLLVCLGFVSDKQGKVVCKAIEINIANTSGDYFVNNQNILDLIEIETGNQIGKKINEISLSRIEKAVEKEPHIAKAEAYLTIDGELKIDVIQKKAVVRIINATGESFYLDEQGWVMPLSVNYAAQVPVATGNITDTESLFAYRSLDMSADDKIANLTILDDIFAISNYIYKDTFWSAQVQQLVVNDKGEIVIIPTLGSHVINFGKAENLPEKFDKLFKFYLQGLNKIGWNKYSVIDLKFKNQVVCTKNNLPLEQAVKEPSPKTTEHP